MTPRHATDGGRILPVAARTVIGLTLLTPLIVWQAGLLYPFVTSKVLFFRSLVEVLVGLWVLLWIRRRSAYGLRWTPISIAVGAFLSSQGISTALGVDPHRSVWDTHERMLGWFTLLHYGTYYAALTSLVRDRRTWDNILLGFLGVSSAVMALGVTQKLFPGWLHGGRDRVGSTLGQPIYLGGLGLFMICSSVLLSLESRSLRLRRLCAVAGILACAGILLSQTRGALVALGAGVAGGLACAIVGVGGRRSKLALAGLLASACLCGVLLIALRDSRVIQTVPALARLSDISLTTRNALTRTLAWDVALEAAAERPLVGWGPCNFYHAFNEHYRPRFLDFGWRETWWDHAHNEPLNVLVTQGAVGLLAYLCLLIVPPLLCWRAHRRGAAPLGLAAVAVAFFLAHGVRTFFAFEDPTSLLYSMLFLGYLNHRWLGESDALVETSHQSTGARAAPIGALVVCLVGAGIWLANVQPGRVSHLGVQVMRLVHDGQPVAALRSFERSESLPSPHHDVVRVALATAALKTLDNYIAVGRSDEGRRLLLEAHEALRRNVDGTRRDIRSVILAAKVAQRLRSEFGAVDLADETEEQLEAALERSPDRQEILFLLSSLELQSGKTEEAIAHLEASIDGDARTDESWWRLALLYASLGQDEKAKEVIEEARARGIEFRARGRDVVERILR